MRRRLAEVCIFASILATAAAAISISLGELNWGITYAMSAFAVALAALAFASCRPLSTRMLGYSVATALLAVLVGAAGLVLPRDWSEPRPAPTAPTVKPADGVADVPPGPPPEFPSSREKQRSSVRPNP